MNALNSLLTVVTEWCLWPLATWPLLALLVISVITGVLMSLIFKYVSNQSAMGTVLDRSQGHLLAIKLFQDDLPGIFRSLANVFRYAMLRLWYSLSPVLVLIVPLVFLMAQLFLRYEYRPLTIGEETIVQLQLHEEAWSAYRNAQPEASPEFSVETHALRDEERHAIYWRVRAAQPGLSTLRWKLGTQAFEKCLVAAEDTQRLRQVSARRPGSGWWDRIWHAGEPSCLGTDPVAAALVYYPRRETPIFGLNLPWWATFFFVSIIAALAAQPVLKVRF